MKTLLVIDMQNAWLNGDVPRFERAGVIERINLAARWMRAQGGKVIFVLHENEEALAGTPAWDVDAGLFIDAADRMVEKNACDSFAGTGLLARLREDGTDTVYICGLATEFCVDTTVRAAPSHGFDVVVLADAHTTGDRPHLEAAHIVAHHNWIWSNMALPAGRRLAVRTLEQVLAG